jgi:anti-sigma B factor antagonist
MGENAEFSTHLTECRGMPIIHLSGEIDLYTVPQFQQALRAGIDAGAPAIIVDLTNVQYIDSAGLSAIIAAYKELSSLKRRLFVVAPQNHPGVSRVLEISRLNTIIAIRGSLEEVITEIDALKAA